MSSITLQSLGKIVYNARRQYVRKCGVCLKRQTAAIKFTHRPNINIFTPQGQLVVPIHVEFDTAEGHVGPLAEQNFMPIGIKGGNVAPNWQIFPLFGKESLRRGEPFDRFLQLLLSIYTFRSSDRPVGPTGLSDDRIV